MPDRTFDTSWPALIRGAIAILFGILMLCWPMTLEDVVVLCGWFAITHGVFTTTLARYTTSKSQRFHVLFLQTIMDTLLGVFALIYPADALWTLFVWIPAWAMIMGVLQIAYGWQSHRTIKRLLALSGAIQLLFGVLLFVWPLLVVPLTAIGSLLFGATLLAAAWKASRPSLRLSNHDSAGGKVLTALRANALPLRLLHVRRPH
jgi:uncharacterized membrane protein HdeD (DUF308 family)